MMDLHEAEDVILAARAYERSVSVAAQSARALLESAVAYGMEAGLSRNSVAALLDVSPQAISKMRAAADVRVEVEAARGA